MADRRRSIDREGGAGFMNGPAGGKVTPASIVSEKTAEPGKSPVQTAWDRTRRIKGHVVGFYAKLHGDPPALPPSPFLGVSLARKLGYPETLLRTIPSELGRSIAPCGNPLALLDAVSGMTILNLGCGCGLDSLAVASEFGGSIEIVNADIVPAALRLGREIAALQGHRMAWICADAERLPFRPESFDLILMNGIFNLFPEKTRLLGCCREALKPEGRLLVTDLFRTGPLPEGFEEEMDAWAWCLNGSCTLEHLRALLELSGFALNGFHDRIEETDVFFRGTISARKEL